MAKSENNNNQQQRVIESVPTSMRRCISESNSTYFSMSSSSFHPLFFRQTHPAIASVSIVR